MYLGSPSTDFVKICTIYAGGYGSQYARKKFFWSETWVNGRKLKFVFACISGFLRPILLKFAPFMQVCMSYNVLKESFSKVKHGWMVVNWKFVLIVSRVSFNRFCWNLHHLCKCAWPTICQREIFVKVKHGWMVVNWNFVLLISWLSFDRLRWNLHHLCGVVWPTICCREIFLKWNMGEWSWIEFFCACKFCHTLFNSET